MNKIWKICYCLVFVFIFLPHPKCLGLTTDSMLKGHSWQNICLPGMQLLLVMYKKESYPILAPYCKFPFTKQQK